ncbi:hypothetical protein CBR_g12683 [Chara braunii]|uniref:Uncharacterized protein n=1 Tax=Chara braunii TaxID=69332 RepID=A0A388KSC8_CHABU|nr:hypothetical protein CBR_g12683 [Chara braunii]|eukprot:GBG72964.1 hypothetical protein CBR_g12683 [Chara braunii]
MGVLTEEERENEQRGLALREGTGNSAIEGSGSGEEMRVASTHQPQLTWADRLKTPQKGQVLTIQRGQGSPRSGKLEVSLEGLPPARAFFLGKFLLPSETRVVNHGGRQTMVKAYPNHGIAGRDEIYTRHANNWVFHDDAAFKTTNDKVRWIGRRLEILKESADLARDQFLIQPVTSTLFTVLSMYESDKQKIDGWKRLCCERSEVRIHPWMPQRRPGPEERRAQLMQDFHWVEFRHIPVEIQAAFVYDFGLLYDIVAFIDPLPSYVAKRDNYLMLALDFPQGQPFSLDDVIPYRVGGKEYLIHTAHKLRPWCHKCRAYGHLCTDYNCPMQQQKRARATGRLLRDPFKVTHWRTVDPGHEGWVFVEEPTKEGPPVGWIWEKYGEPDWGTCPPDARVPPAPVEKMCKQEQRGDLLPQKHTQEELEWKSVGKKKGKGTWVQKQQTGSEQGPSDKGKQASLAATPGPSAERYLHDAASPPLGGIAKELLEKTDATETTRNRTRRNAGGERLQASAELRGGEEAQMADGSLMQQVSECPGGLTVGRLERKQGGEQTGGGKERGCRPGEGQEEVERMEVEEGDKGGEGGGRRLGEGQENGEQMEVERGDRQNQQKNPDPFQAAFAPEPMEVDPLPENTAAAPGGLDEEGAPPSHLPPEQKLVAIADWLVANLKAKYGPLTDDF